MLQASPWRAHHHHHHHHHQHHHHADEYVDSAGCAIRADPPSKVRVVEGFHCQEPWKGFFHKGRHGEVMWAGGPGDYLHVQFRHPQGACYVPWSDLGKLRVVAEAPPKSALIVVDMQNDFINGTLPVPGAMEIIPAINKLVAMKDWSFVGFTMDFHPHDHASFAASHPGAEVFSQVNLDYTADGKLCSEEYAKAYKGSAQASCQSDEIEHSLQQTLWPTHCVQGTFGQKIHHDVVVPHHAALVRKGFTSVVDSYGAFESRIGTHESNLAAILRLAGVRTVYTVGLALDYCVKSTAVQAAALGFETKVIGDATKAVAQATGEQALDELESNGITVVQSESLTPCH